MLFTSPAIINKKQDNIRQDTVYECNMVLLAGYSLISVSSSHQCSSVSVKKMEPADFTWPVALRHSVGSFFISLPHVILMCSSCQFSTCFPNIT